MSSVVIAGNTSGSVTLAAPDVAGTTTLSLPASTGTLATEAYAQNAGFASGTRLAFQQTAAPTGWTKDTTAGLNDSIMRIVTGSASSGGSTAFSTWAAVTSAGATTLAESQIPSHNHTVGLGTNVSGSGAIKAQSAGSSSPLTSSSTGGGGSHTHSLSNNIKYYDFIIASKN